MIENLTDVLDEIQYEYNLGYETTHEEAIIRVIEILKEHELDEAWSEVIANQYKLMYIKSYVYTGVSNINRLWQSI